MSNQPTTPEPSEAAMRAAEEVVEDLFPTSVGDDWKRRRASIARIIDAAYGTDEVVELLESIIKDDLVGYRVCAIRMLGRFKKGPDNAH